MAKLGWDKFVDLHQSGHCFTLGTRGLKRPAGVSPKNGKAYPTIQNIIVMTVKAIAKDDWAVRADSVPTVVPAKGKRKSHVTNLPVQHLVFKSGADCMAVTQAFGLLLTRLTPASAKPCNTQNGVPFDPSTYARLVFHFGY